MKNIDKARQVYIYLNKPNGPYKELAENMLKLIDQLDTDPSFHDITANTGMMTLQLGFSDNPRRVHVHWISPSRYTVGLDFYESKYRVETEEVEELELVDKIREYLRKI